MKTLYIIRHGQTEQNRQNMVQGSRIDSELNETGYAQADAFYQMYRHVQFDKIYLSELKRTRQTAHPFIKEGIHWETHHGLNEIKWGNREGRILTKDDDQEYYQMLRAWENGEIHRKFDGGESPLEMSMRQQLILQIIMSRPTEKNVLVCMHGRAMRSFMCLLSGISVSQMHLFSHSNTALYKVHFDGSKFHIIQNNSTAHLQKMYAESPLKQVQFA